MGNYYLHNIDDELMREIKIAAATHGRTVREEVIVRLSIAPPADMLAKPGIDLQPDDESLVHRLKHDPKTCTAYRCGMCIAAKERKGTK